MTATKGHPPNHPFWELLEASSYPTDPTRPCVVRSPGSRAWVLQLTALALTGLLVLAGCSDPRAERRARLCQSYGITDKTQLRKCAESEEGFRELTEPLRLAEEKRRHAEFVNALRTIRQRSMNRIDRHRYARVTLAAFLARYARDGGRRLLHIAEAATLDQHPAVGVLVAIEGQLAYFPAAVQDGELRQEHLDLSQQDPRDTTKQWVVPADIDDLTRPERGFIKRRCEWLNSCRVVAYGSLVAKPLREFAYELAQLVFRLDAVEILESPEPQARRVGGTS